MNKQEFLDLLRTRLAGLPEEDVAERIDFYGEMIEDRMEDGLTEEEAVKDMGEAEEIASRIIGDTPLTKLAKEKIKSKRRLRPWEIVLLALGSPLWLPLLIAAVVVLLALYVVIWSVIVSLWAVFGAMSGSGLGLLIGGGFLCAYGQVLGGLFLIAVGLVSAGLAIFLFFGCLAATKGIGILTKKCVIGMKKCFVRGGKSK